MRRGAFESAELGQVASSAKQSNIEVGSLSRGMTAFGEGLGSVSNMLGKLAEMADKAYSAKMKNGAVMTDSIKATEKSLTALKSAEDAYKESPTELNKVARDNAKTAYDEALKKSDEATDRYMRNGILFSKIGTATAESGASRREASGGDLRKMERQSVIGAMFFKTW